MKTYTDMNFSNITEDKLPLSKLNHLRLNLEDIERLKKLVLHLELRKKIIAKDKTELSDFDKNEREVLAVKTELELAKQHTNILKREMYVIEHKKLLIHYLKEMEQQFSTVYEKITQLKNNKDAENLLSKFDLKSFDENWELAIDFYAKAKTIIDPPKESVEEGKMKKVN